MLKTGFLRIFFWKFIEVKRTIVYLCFYLDHHRLCVKITNERWLIFRLILDHQWHIITATIAGWLIFHLILYHQWHRIKSHNCWMVDISSNFGSSMTHNYSHNCTIFCLLRDRHRHGITSTMLILLILYYYGPWKRWISKIVNLTRVISPRALAREK